MKRKTALVLIALSSALIQPVRADEAEHDRARRALEEGRILPLREILVRAESDVPGQLIEAELEDGRDGRLVYELKVLASDGRLVKLIYDAASGELLKTRQRERK